jgi:F-box protein 11
VERGVRFTTGAFGTVVIRIVVGEAMGTSTKVPRVEVGASPTRCPYCHESVHPSAERWVVCAFCLARHHSECWHEGGRCSSCGQEGRLEPVFGPETAAPRVAKPASKSAKDKGAPAEPETTRIWPTLVVSRSGDFTRIGDAIRAAKPGTRILVAKGTWNEPIVIDRPVAIVGDGDKADVILSWGESDVVSMKTDRALLQNVTIRGRSASHERSTAVRVLSGQLRLWDCEVSADAYSASIVVAGATAAPLIKRCRIQGGILFDQDARGTVEECELVRNSKFAIGVKSGAHPTVRNTMVTGGAVGLWISEGGLGTFEGCQIAGTTEHGARVTQGGAPIVRDCTFRDGKGHGISVSDEGEGTFEECRVERNAEANVLVEREAHPTFRRSVISHGRAAGISIRAEGRGRFEAVQSVENAGPGVDISLHGDPCFSGCQIRRNQDVGIHIHDNGRGHIEECDLRGNGRGAWRIAPSCKPHRSDNKE